jgi:hypothetical protein
MVKPLKRRKGPEGAVMDQEWFKKSVEADRECDLSFLCKIGQVDAELNVSVEPDPHGDGTGRHAHFHTIIMCPKIKIPDAHEPDRCRVTDETCPFVEPLGGYERNPDSRKWIYAQQFLHHVSSIEFSGTQLLSASLMSKGIEIRSELPDLSFATGMRLLYALGLIDEPTHKNIAGLRKHRNKLAHDPRAYLTFQEQDLFELMLKSRSLAAFLESRVAQINAK